VRHNRQHLNGEPRWQCLSCQRLIRKRRKRELKHARSTRKNKGRKKKKKKKNQIDKKKKKEGQNGKVNACAPVSFSRRSRQQRLETSRDYRKIGVFHPRSLGAEDFLLFPGRVCNF
jgi:hypothetical protein